MPKFKIAALVSGGGTNLQAIFDAKNANELDVDIEIVISTNSHAYALERAKVNKIETLILAKKDFASDEDRAKALLAAIVAKKVDLVVLCGCMMVLSAEFVQACPVPIINIHPSLLPKFGGKGFYGLNVHEAVLDAGETATGATVHYVDGGIDTGKIILQREVAVHANDTPETLQKRVMQEAEWQILPEAIKIFAEKSGR